MSTNGRRDYQQKMLKSVLLVEHAAGMNLHHIKNMGKEKEKRNKIMAYIYCTIWVIGLSLIVGIGAYLWVHSD